jgi:hypothetical protein
MGILKKYSLVSLSISNPSLINICIVGSFALMIASQRATAQEASALEAAGRERDFNQVKDGFSALSRLGDQAAIQSVVDRLSQVNSKYPGAICRAQGATEVRALDSSSRSGSMPYIPTDEIAMASPDPAHLHDLRLKRFSAVQTRLKAGFPELAQPREGSISLLSPFCPRIGSMSKLERILVFSFLLELNVHELPFLKALAIPLVDFSKMSQPQIDRHRLEYGDQIPPKNKDEVYGLAARFKQQEIEEKARAMLGLFSAKTGTATELVEILAPRTGQQVSLPNEVYERTLSLQLSSLRVCQRERTTDKVQGPMSAKPQTPDTISGMPQPAPQ